MKQRLSQQVQKLHPGLRFFGVLGAVLLSGIGTGILIGHQFAHMDQGHEVAIHLETVGQLDMGRLLAPTDGERERDLVDYDVAVRVTRSETALKDFQFEEFDQVDTLGLQEGLEDLSFDIEAADHVIDPSEAVAPKGEESPIEQAALTPVSPIDAPVMWKQNAVEVDLKPGRKLISIVIDDLGIDQPHTKAAIDLPAPMSMAFIPYGYNLQRHVDHARRSGHEIMVHMPMEPINRRIDPGPYALKVGLDREELKKRIEWSLSQFEGYVGVNNHMGSRYTAWDEGMGLVMDALKKRELLFLDSFTSRNTLAYKKARSMNVSHDIRDIFLDHDQDRRSIDRQLRLMMKIADRKGVVIAIGHPHDTTLAALKAWYETLDQSQYQLIPISKAVELHMQRLTRDNLAIING